MSMMSIWTVGNGLLCIGVCALLLSLSANYVLVRLFLIVLERLEKADRDIQQLRRKTNRSDRAEAPSRPSSSLSSDELSRLLRLCHPDLHPPARQAEATALTARLNALRAKDSPKKSGRRT